MKEQLLVYFSPQLNCGLIIEFTPGGEVEFDCAEGGCITTDDLNLAPPMPFEHISKYVGIWLWEGVVNCEDISEVVEYVGSWRRLDGSELSRLNAGMQICNVNKLLTN